MLAFPPFTLKVKGSAENEGTYVPLLLHPVPADRSNKAGVGVTAIFVKLSTRESAYLAVPLWYWTIQMNIVRDNETYVRQIGVDLLKQKLL